MATDDMFAGAGEFRRLEIPDADVQYMADMPMPKPASELLDELIAAVPWRSEEVFVWGKRHLQPRLTAWYGDAGSAYTYSGLSLQPLPWTDTLQALRRAVESCTRRNFNSVLINYYRDQNDSMGFHSDDEPELGENPAIASISLGEERTFVLKHRSRKDLAAVKIRLSSGSLLLMKGETQKHWKHGIGKESRPCGARVNLTFRRIVGRPPAVSDRR